MDRNQYKNFLLSSISGARLASGGNEIQCRCFNTSCEDCYDYRSKGHFYISIPKDNDEPSKFNCFKCGYSGIVTHNTLLEWNIFDQSIAEELIKFNSSIKPKNIDKYNNRKVFKVFNTATTESDISEFKRKYINDRLGINLSFDEMRRLKIILNLYDVLNENNITTLTRDKNIVDQLNINFLGFLSIDNVFVNMRRLCDKGLVYKSIDKRYINYKLFDKFDTSERFYVIPTAINIYNPMPIKINIAEGPFDILSVYFNILNKEPGIYIAGAGCNYFGIFLYCLQVFGIINGEIHFYADNDEIANKKLNIALGRLKDFRIPVYVHKNIKENEKDFGVRSEQIQESVMRIY